MKRTSILSVIATCFMLPTSGLADKCSSANTQLDMNLCAGQSLARSDAELNLLYKQLIQRLRGDANATVLKALVTAQRSWNAYRDKECDFVASRIKSGSALSMIVTNCHDTLTRKRINDFKRYLSCQEGDLSCPVPTQ